MAKVVIDIRERNTELAEAIAGNGVEVEFAKLEVGDYAISDRVCIERKTMGDFESSIISGRLFEQAERLRESYPIPILVLEGDRDCLRLGSSVISGAMAALCIDYGIYLLHSGSASGTASLVARIAKREQEDNRRELSLKGGARMRTTGQFQERVVANIPGIGPKLSRELLRHFKSIRNIALADQKRLMEVDKIGSKKAGLIISTLNEDYVDGGNGEPRS